MSDLMVTQETRLSAANVDELTALANKLMAFPPGKPLNLKEAAQLAATSYMLGADPYNDELYSTNIGIQKGIMLYRRKAKEYNMEVHGSDGGYSIRFVQAKDGEADFNKAAGDVAWIAELVDEVQHKRWEGGYVKFFNMFIEAGANFKEADGRATQLSGPEPIHTGIGVVDHRESFSKEQYVKDGKGRSVMSTDESGNPIYKPEMMDRNQRAKKRAEKAALKAAYPSMMTRLDRPNDEEPEDLSRLVGVIVKEVDRLQIEAESKPAKPFNEKKALEDLGFEQKFDIAEDSPELEEAIEGEIVDGPGEVQKTLPVITEPRFGATVSENVISAKVGFVDIMKLNAAFELSNILSPAMEQKFYNMWSSFYADSRKKGNDKSAAADEADSKIANLLEDN